MKTGSCFPSTGSGVGGCREKAFPFYLRTIQTFVYNIIHNWSTASNPTDGTIATTPTALLFTVITVSKI